MQVPEPSQVARGDLVQEPGQLPLVTLANRVHRFGVERKLLGEGYREDKEDSRHSLTHSSALILQRM